MKETIITLLALAGVAAAQVTIDLSPTSITSGLNANGITAAELSLLPPDAWQGTWENAYLNNFVQVNNNTLNIQIGAAASNKQGGNFAAVRFEADTPLTLTFDITKAGSWGTNINSFSAEYTCKVYGFTSDGGSAEIGSWSSGAIAGSSNTAYSSSANITLESGEYSSYGVIFNAIDQSSLGSGAGMSVNITNIKVTTENLVPEPATATLSLFALAGLAARRRRK